MICIHNIFTYIYIYIYICVSLYIYGIYIYLYMYIQRTSKAAADLRESSACWKDPCSASFSQPVGSSCLRFGVEWLVSKTHRLVHHSTLG